MLDSNVHDMREASRQSVALDANLQMQGILAKTLPKTIPVPAECDTLGFEDVFELSHHCVAVTCIVEHDTANLIGDSA